MKDLMKLVAECKAELDSISVPYQTVHRWKVNTRAKARWGYCKKLWEGAFEIQIAQCLLEDTVDDIAVKTTIIHELLHTVKGCHGHKGKWKEYAEYVNRKLPKYHIKRTTSHKEKGIEYKPRTVIYRYVFECQHCKRQVRRERSSKFVENYERYTCGNCGGRFTRIK